MMDMYVDFHNCDANVVDSFKEPKFFLNFIQISHREFHAKAAKGFHAAITAKQRRGGCFW